MVPDYWGAAMRLLNCVTATLPGTSCDQVAQGVDVLFREGLPRLAGRSDQAAFELARAMGGGNNTHLMMAVNLFAKRSHLRSELPPPELKERLDFGPALIASINGRNAPDRYSRGEIAEQLGQTDLIRPFY